jgi:hypothetical protein
MQPLMRLEDQHNSGAIYVQFISSPFLILFFSWIVAMFRIDDELIQFFRKWFHGYVESFCTDESDIRENILLKKKHTKRVCGEILRIGRRLGLSGEPLRLAEITALFHDIGRFDQYLRYRTFVDHKSENHAELSVEILKSNRVFDCLNDSIKNLVYRIISYHNRPFLPDGETDRCLFYTKLLRDADKLDILRVLTRYYRRSEGKANSAIELDLPDTPEISDEVYAAVMNKRIVDVHHIKTFNDFKVLQIGWIFDVNFKPTLDTIVSRNYIHDICSALPVSEKVETIKKVVNHYVDKAVFEENKEGYTSL